jgi:hypothetical protein
MIDESHATVAIGVTERGVAASISAAPSTAIAAALVMKTRQRTSRQYDRLQGPGPPELQRTAARRGRAAKRTGTCGSQRVKQQLARRGLHRGETRHYVVVNLNWEGRDRARSLRHWPIIEHVASQVAKSDSLDALIIAGSFAKNRADEASDVDLIITVAPGRFDAAWDQRAFLQTPDALFAWDVRRDPGRPAGARKFISRDIVKVEMGISDPTATEDDLADPYVVLVGDASVVERYKRLPPIPSDVLEAYAQKMRDEGLVPEVEMRYGDLMRAIRAARSV